MLNCFFVGIGGFLGSIFRYLLSQMPIKSQMNLPITTLIINITGSFVIGFITARAVKSGHADENMILFLKVGLCGGFTTFTTFSLESHQLFQNGQTAGGLLYIALSIALCILSVAGAEAMGQGDGGVGTKLFVPTPPSPWYEVKGISWSREEVKCKVTIY